MKAAIRIGVRRPSSPVLKSSIAEWALTVIMLLFGTTRVLQAFVIPTGSMENTLPIGDHLLVDKLVYAPADTFTQRLLPYRDVKRGDVIVFRYSLDLKVTYVKRAIGIPGDRIRLENKRLILNGVPVDEPYVHHLAGNVAYRDNFPSASSTEALRPTAAEMLENHVVNGELVVPPGFIFAMGDNRGNSDDSRYWGFVPRENIIGTVNDLLVIRCVNGRFDQSRTWHRAPGGCGRSLRDENPLGANVSVRACLSAAAIKK